MKHSLPLIALLAISSLSCNDDPSTPPPPEPIIETRVIRDVDYVKDKFFLVDDPEAFMGAFPYSVEVFVTVRPEDLILDPTILRFPGWAIADSTAEGDMIAAAVAEIQVGGTPDRALRQEFRRLRGDVDYSLLVSRPDTVAVGIELKTPIPAAELRSVAIRYRNQLGEVIGGSVGSPDTLILELIKAPDPKPLGVFGILWNFAMRNAYDLGFDPLTPARLSVVIREVNTTRADSSRPDSSNVRYVQIFGLDQTDASGSGPPDGKIDNFFLNWSEDLKRGILWMPVGHAFAPPAERVLEWTNGAFEFSGPYLPQYEKASRIYTEFLNPTAEQDVHQYIIEATVTTPAP